MHSFLRPKSATPKTSRGDGMPEPITPGGSPDEVQVVSGPDLSLNKHGGRRGIPSSVGELASILEQYRDESFSTGQKRAQSKGAIHVLSTMENASVQLGDWSGCGQRGNAGNLRHLLGLMSKEVAAMRHLASAQGKAQICVQDGGKKLARLKEIVGQAMGRTQAHRLKSASDGHIGKLNASLNHAYTAVVEEASLKLSYTEVITDRYDFATLKLPELRKLRDE
jgi:hypothetical protein